MSVAKAYVDTGLEELQRRLGDQGGLQVEEAYGGGATAAKALSAATSKAMGGHRAWLTQSWLLTVMSLLQEGEALLEEQNHLQKGRHQARRRVGGPQSRSTTPPSANSWTSTTGKRRRKRCSEPRRSTTDERGATAPRRGADVSRVACAVRRVTKSGGMGGRGAALSYMLELLCSGCYGCLEVELGQPPPATTYKGTAAYAN